MKQVGVTITATGSYLPEKVLTNHDLERIVDTSDDWVRTRTDRKSTRLNSSHYS